MTVTSRILCEPGTESLDVSSRPMKKRSGICEGKQANIAVVDDDQSVRESLPHLLKILGFTAQAFASAEEFLASDFFRETECLILDVAMRGMSGPQLQTELKRLGSRIPIIFITAQSDQSLRQRLVEQQGAVACLLKPFSDTALVEALNQALHLS
jgi:FixJ family two-component response regulator